MTIKLQEKWKKTFNYAFKQTTSPCLLRHCLQEQQLSFELPPARLVARLLIDQRNAERAEAPQQTMVELRKRTDSEYRDLIMILNAYALTDETATSYRTLINILNEDVNYYEKTVFAGSGSSSSSNGQNGSNGENGTTEPGSGDNGGGTLVDDPDAD